MKMGVPITLDDSSFDINVPKIAPFFWDDDGGIYQTGSIVWNTRLPDAYKAYRATGLSIGTTDSNQPALNLDKWERVPEFDHWEAGVTYAEGDNCVNPLSDSQGGFGWYESLANSNTGNNPSSSPLSWRFLCRIYSPWRSLRLYTSTSRIYFDKRIYQSLSVNTGNNPSTNPEYWLDIGAANAYALIDEKTSTQTVYGEDIVITADVDGYAGTLALLEVDASEVNVTVMDGATEVYNVDFQMIDTVGVIDWWTYYFSPVISKRTLVVTDLPSVLNPTIIVTIKNNDGEMRGVGHFALTTLIDIGNTEYGARIGYDDYSVFQTDGFGNRFIVQRGYSNWGRFTVWVERDYVDYVMKLLRDNRATPCIFVGTSSYDSTVYFGTPKNVEMSISYPQHSILELQVDGF